MLAFTCAAAAASAQPVQYPSKSIRLVVPTVARTPLDHVARIIGRGLTEAWDQPVLVDNRASGNGVAGQELVAGAQPDGHTLLLQSPAFVTLPLFHKLPHDAERDFLPVARIASSALVLVTHPSVAASSVKELIVLANRQPGTLRYASWGNGSLPHLAGELFSGVAKMKLTHVAQRDVPEAFDALLAGRTQIMFVDVAYARPHAGTGALRALAITARAKSPLMPDLPALAEAGLTGYEIDPWIGAFAPAGTPAAIVERLASELARILETPGTDRLMLAQGYVPGWLSATDFQRLVKSDSQKFSALVKKSGVSR